MIRKIIIALIFVSLAIGIKLRAQSTYLTAFYIPNTSSYHIFFVGTNKHIYEEYLGSNGVGYTDITAAAGGTLALQYNALVSFYITGSASEHVFFEDVNGHIHELWSNNSGWHDSDQTEDSHATPAFINNNNPDTPIGSALTAFDIAGGIGNEHVFFEDANGHIHELWSDTSENWHDGDLTTYSSGALAVQGSSLTSFPTNNNTLEHVFFKDANGHIHELWSDTSENWHDGDLTTYSSGALAVQGSPLTSFSTNNNALEHVFFKDANGHIHELWSDTSENWHDGDLTTYSGGAIMLGNSLTSFYTGGIGNEHVFFTDNNRDVHELWSDSTDTWHDQNLSARATGQASPPSASSPLFSLYVFTNGVSSESVYFVGQNQGFLNELVSDNGNWGSSQLFDIPVE